METSTHRMLREIGWDQGLNLLFTNSCTLENGSIASGLFIMTNALNLTGTGNPGLTVCIRDEASIDRQCHLLRLRITSITIWQNWQYLRFPLHQWYSPFQLSIQSIPSESQSFRTQLSTSAHSQSKHPKLDFRINFQ